MHRLYLFAANWVNIFFLSAGIIGVRKENEKTVFYAEYGSKGAGTNPQARAAFSRQLKNLKGYEPVTVLAGDDGWNPVRDGNRLLDVKR